ncbi:PREDICTED: uncharacterized protein LOC106116512 [Papilio xuthus]|uniref:Uncharacterized protein LOC106116512 n=1 Tax=Papilio xuthus TaxID=66420 RepID=A0AAJ6Z5M4_PAPXU|nr:PREDICTED: uncharacterized protein LOC106116512 [Papilio xuthus]
MHVLLGHIHNSDYRDISKYRMWTSMWFTSVLAILVADIRTGAFQNKEVEGRQCYQCPTANTTACSQQKVAVSCPLEQPYCGTVAVGPHFDSLLKCLPEFKSSCTMKLISNSIFELSCVCSGVLCNAPFTKTTQTRLMEFAKSNTVDNSSDVTKAFYKYFKLENTTDIYKAVTNEEVKTTVSYATMSSVTKLNDVLIINTNHTNEIDLPHAEPLKHEATVPPDDDEDETEGSGTYDDTKTPKNTVSAPAAPSSFLPAEENKASKVVQNILFIIPLSLDAL